MSVWVSVIVAAIGLLGTVLSSGGVVMFFLNRKEKREEKREQKVLNGLKILMENDAVIFKAFRNNHINGESEAQEEKMNTFFREMFI